MIGNEKLSFNNSNELIEYFNFHFKNGYKLQCVKSFMWLSNLDLRDSKAWVDNNWFEGIGHRVYEYLQSKEVLKSYEKEFNLNEEFFILHKKATELHLEEQFENLCLTHLENYGN